MKKLLFITSQLPFPPVKGGVIVSWNLLKRLAEDFEVSVGTVLKGEDQQHEANFLKQLTLDDYFSEPIEIGRSPKALLTSYLKGVPLNFIRNYSSVLEEKIHQSLPQYDYVLIDHYEMFQYIPQQLEGPKVILHEHNAEHVMWERYARLTKNPVRKLLTALESRRIKAKEIAFCERADLVLAYPNDRKILQALCSSAVNFQEITPCGEEELQQAPKLEWSQTEPALLFVGSLGWEANRDGLVWFLENGWEQLKAKVPAAKFYIVGADPDEHLRGLAERLADVVLTGFVAEVEDYYSRCRVFVSPLRFGSGIKIKVINAAHRGMPTVTTPIGVEGMPFVNGEEIFFNNDILSFVEHCSQLLQNQSQWEEMRDKIRLFAQHHFSWAEMLKRIRKQILALDN
ncbi:MAG: glycosyltransferase family 4 protein [Bacteroidota bacterium]